MKKSLPILNAASFALAIPSEGGLGEYVASVPAPASAGKRACKVDVHYRLCPFQQKLASAAAAIYRAHAKLR